MMTYTGTYYGDIVSDFCAIIATNVNIRYFPLGGGSANWSVSPYVNSNMKKYWCNLSEFYYLVIINNPITNSRYILYLVNFSSHQSCL